MTAALLGLLLTGGTVSTSLLTGAGAAQAAPPAAPAAVTPPAAGDVLLDVDFADGTPSDHSPSARAATTIGTPTYATDATLGRSLPSFNDDAGAGNGAVVDGDADGYTYDISDAYDAGALQDGFAFECVFRTDTTDATAAENEICGDKNGAGFGMYFSANTLKLNAVVGISTVAADGSAKNAYKSASATLTANTWYDAVGVWDGAQIRLYLDGHYAATAAAAASTTTASTKSGDTFLTVPAASRRVFTLGGSPTSATEMSYRGQETMAGARLWSTPLSTGQVAEAASTEVTPAISGLSFPDAPEPEATPTLPADTSWPKDVRKPNVFDVDFAGGAATDTVTGATGTVARNTGATDPAIVDDTTLNQKVASFDGTNAYAFATDAWQWNNKIVQGNALSMECVFKLDASVSATHYSYPCGEIYSGGAGFYTTPYAAGAPTATLQARVGFPGYSSTATTVATDTWYDAVMVWNGENIMLYLNGKLVSMGNVPGSQIVRPSYDFLTIGGAAKSATSLNTGDLNSLWGSVAASRVWTQPLSDAEIAGLYQLSGVPAGDDDDGGTPAVTVPKADVLDVDLQHGDTTDRANGGKPTVFGRPTQSFDGTLNHTIETFDGAQDALSYDFSDYWNPGHTPNVTSGFTVECYFRSNGAASVLQKTCSGEQTGGISIAVPANTTDKVQAELYVDGAYHAIPAGITPGAWNHVVFTYDGSSERLYVNGALKAFGPVSGKVAPPGGLGFNLGADIAGSYPSAESFSNASVAIARVWSSALSSEQVGLLYAKDTTHTAVPDADILDVDFQDGYSDKSDNKVQPEEYGTPQLVEDPTLGRTVGAFGGDGSAQVYDLTPMWSADNDPNMVDGFTIQCDFRYDGTLPTTSEQDVCSGKQTGGYSINVSGSSIRMRTCVGDGGTKCPYVTAPIEAGVWYGLVATWDPATGAYDLYLNGEQVAGSTLAGAGDDPQATPMGWALGADVNGSGQPETPAPVTIAEARIWSAALDAAQVNALYQQDFGTAHTDISLTSSQPAAGDKITKAEELQVSIANKDQATGWTYEIDGRAVQPGSTIGSGFAAGSHVLTITATDSFGVPVQFSVPFTSSNIPDTGAAGVGQGDGKVTLSAVATSPTGSDVTTTFKAATASVADGGETGAIPAIPATLDFASTGTRTLTGSQDFDDTSVDSVKEHDLLPYQRFDVAVPGGDARHVKWAGTVDPERTVTLYGWDTVDESWQQVATAGGNASGQTILEGDVRESMVDSTVHVDAADEGAVHLLVVATDPFNDDLSPRDGSNKGERFQDPASYDFSFVHWTDPQYIAEGAAGGAGHYPASPVYQTAQGDNAMRETDAEQKVWAAAYNDAAQWTVDNAEKRKIAYASNTGDIINNNLVDPAAPDNLAKYGPDAAHDENASGAPYSEQKDQIDRENAFAKTAFGKIWQWRNADGKGLVSQVVAGNHDDRNGADAKTDPEEPTNPDAQSTIADDFYNKTFTADDYYQQAQDWPAGASYHTIDEETDASGKVVKPGTDNQDNYVLFSAGGQDFVAVGLSYGVTKAEADWASDVFARYSDRNGILITHGYLSASKNPDGRTAPKSSDGSRLYTRVVTANPNVFLVLAGHVHGVGTNILQVKDKTATVTHKTVELLADYQEYQMPAKKIFTAEHCQAAGLDPATQCQDLGDGTIDVDGDGTADHHDTDELKFGASFLRLLQFNLAASTMTVESYSPFFDEYGAADYDEPNKRYNGSEDAFTIPVDLQTRTTSFSTDGVAVLTSSDQVIGTDTAPSGLPATVTWSGLSAGQTYAWTATSVDADGQEAGTADQFGGLFTASRAGTDVTAPSLHVPADTELTAGDSFDPLEGATATDDDDSDLTGSIEVTGDVDTATAGVYPLIYTVADANGNTTQAARVVTVKKAPAPARTATAVTVSNQTVTFGRDATLTATVSPATAAGTVVFSNGEDPICEARVVGGRASCVTQNFGGVGGQSYVADATFYPDAVAAYDMSERAFVLTINGATRAPAVRANQAGKPVWSLAKKPTSKKRGKAVVTVAPAASGTVTVKLVKAGKHKAHKAHKAHKSVTVTVVGGKGKVKLPKLAKGTWKVKLTFTGSQFLGSTSKTKLKVKKK